MAIKGVIKLGKLFDFFSPTENKKDKGIKKTEKLVDEKFSTKSFFKLLKNRFMGLITLNVIVTIFLIPIIMFVLGVTGTFSYYTRTPESNMFLVLDGISNYEQGAHINVLLNVFGETSLLSRNSVTTDIFEKAIFAEFVVFGMMNVGFAYVLRETVRCNPVFIISDFFRTIKKNIKQALIFGAIDFGIIALLIYDIYAYNMNASEWIYLMFFYLSILMIFVYFVMRTYIYQMMITFDLSIKKLLKNAFLFTFIGLKRNFVGLLAVTLVVVLNYLLLSITFTFSLALVLPFVLTIALCGLISVYCAYPQIKKHMIDPYYESIGKTEGEEDDDEYDDEDDDEDEPVFVDRG